MPQAPPAADPRRPGRSGVVLDVAVPAAAVHTPPASGSPSSDRAASARPRGTGAGWAVRRRRQSLGEWLRELVRFAFVGAAAYVVDTGLFNLLLLGPGQVLGDQPVVAKVVSASVATLVAWLGNRYWTFSGSKRASRTRELIMFALVNVGGMAVAVLTLAVSHYVLGFTSPLADNIAANVVGVGLGTVFRYLCYRYVVFTGPR